MNSPNSADRAVRLEFVVVLALEVALVAALHAVGRVAPAVPLASLDEWLRVEDPAVVLAALARLVAMVIGYWLLTTTVLYGAAHHLGWDSVTGILRWVTLPIVRRVVQGVTAVSLTGASIVGPATASIAPVLAQGSEVVAQVDGDGGLTDQTGDGDDAGEPDDSGFGVDAAGWPERGPDGEFWRPAAPARATADGSYTVVPLDHFWKIAENHLRQAVRREVTEDEICRYWVRLIDANRQTILSGDPDLIFVGERFTLPPVFADGD